MPADMAPRGEITSRDLMVTGLATLVVAIVIVVIVIILNTQKGQGDAQTDAEKRIQQIKEQATEGGTAAEGSESGVNEAGGANSESSDNALFAEGALTRISGDTLTITDQNAGTSIQVRFTNKTDITYGNERFSPDDFYLGDQLTAYAGKKSSGVWEAERIVVRFSASPETHAPVPKLEERPDGGLKPLGNS